MSDLIREIDEELRTERVVATLTRWQPVIIGVGIAALLGVGGFNYYQKHQQQAREAAGLRYQSALDLARIAGTDPAKAKVAEAALLGVAKDAPAGYKMLALLRAAALTSALTPQAGVKDYDGLSKNAALSPLYQDVARLRAAMLRLDSADLKEMRQRLEPLIGAASPFRNLAREILAIAAFKAGNFKLAGDNLEAIIVDPHADASMRARAGQLSALIRSGALPDASGAAAVAPAAPAVTTPPK
ncbi:MAG: tetratricopeptide repeat protein [Hyphomicrobiales bacterium]|nr:tetratricopeptide repeat protein [Hyphomicrobiales bacterium]